MAPVRARDPTAATSTTIVLQLYRTTRIVRYALLLLARDMISTLLVWQYGYGTHAASKAVRPYTTTAWSIQHDAEDMRCVNHSFGDGPTRSHLRPHRGIEHPTDFAIRLRRANSLYTGPYGTGSS